MRIKSKIGLGKDPFLPTGGTGLMATLTSAIMVLLCCISVALSGAVLKMSERWSSELVETASIRIPAADPQTLDEQTAAIQTFLSFTPGIESSEVLDRPLTESMMREWIGNDIDLSEIDLPRIIRLSLSGEPFDVDILKSQLQAAAPNAHFDDHSQWRGALGQTVFALRFVSFGIVFLLIVALAVLIWLTLKTAVAANGQVISVMRSLGAENRDIIRGFVGRYVGLIGLGSSAGFSLGVVLLLMIPEPAEGDAFLSDITPSGLDWVVLAWVPVFALALAFSITRGTVRAVLETEG